MEELLAHCMLCPRKCGVNRLAGERGVCGESAVLRVARSALHFWEEPILSGDVGSGTVFFSGCSLKCVYCQNKEISTGESGKEISTERLAQMFLELQAQNAANINLVSPTHFVPQILSALRIAKSMGLKLPVVYNTGGYECVEVLSALRHYVDIYLTDFKYFSPYYAEKFSFARDYPERAMEALDEMVRQCPEMIPGDDGMLRRGVMVRILLLPGLVDDAKDSLKYLFETYGNKICYSLMRQYTPYKIPPEFPMLSRRVSEQEYETLVDYALYLGIENAFIQEDGTAEESFIPPFDYTGI